MRPVFYTIFGKRIFMTPWGTVGGLISLSLSVHPGLVRPETRKEGACWSVSSVYA